MKWGGHSYIRNSGFTIVELLIVIVVIAILASITIVSYNGITTRATNTKILAAVREYATVLEIYKIETGEYPNVETEYLCLPGTYPAEDGFLVDSCEYNGYVPNTPSGYVSSSGYDIREMLGEYQKDLPDASYGKVFDNMNISPNQRVRGLLYSNDGSPHIDYHLVNATSCPIGDRDMFPGTKGITCSYFLK